MPTQPTLSRRQLLEQCVGASLSLAPIAAYAACLEPRITINDPSRGGTLLWKATGTVDNVNTFAGGNGIWTRPSSGAVNVRTYGATGVGDTRLVSSSRATSRYSYYLNDISNYYETVDGKAFKDAIAYLRSQGGGELYVPTGRYVVYGYLDDIDFPCTIYGDGVSQTIIQSHAQAPGYTHGFGLLLLSPFSGATVNVRDLTLDGNVQNKSSASETVSHTVGIYGTGRVNLTNVSIMNGVCDCLYVNYDNTGTQSANTSLTLTNCTLSNAYRNTLSIICGSNQTYTNVVIEKAGYVHGGTSPKSAMDIEPDNEAILSQHITFNSCTFRDSPGAPVTGGRSVGDVTFNDCVVEVMNHLASDSNAWATISHGGQLTFNRCTFKDTTHYNSIIFFYFPVREGQFVGSEFVKYANCQFIGIGVLGVGCNMIIDGCTFTNALRPLAFHLDQEPSKSLSITNTTLVNIVDQSRYYRCALFAENIQANCAVTLNNIQIRYDSTLAPTGRASEFTLATGETPYRINIKGQTSFTSIST
jgi:hypothetical protein